MGTKCDRLECHEEYIEESARTFGERLKEYFGAPSSIYDYAKTSGHHTKLDNFSMVGRESQILARTIREAMFIGFKDPSLNRNIGKYQLSHIWNGVLFICVGCSDLVSGGYRSKHYISVQIGLHWFTWVGYPLADIYLR